MSSSKRRDLAWPLPDRPDHPAYLELLAEIQNGDVEQGWHLFRESCLNDFWFFVRHCLSLGQMTCRDPFNPHAGKRWLDHPWLFERCREIQADPDGRLDLWGRYHYKTALITQSLSLWDLIDDPELRILILTYKLDTTGEGFLTIPQRECETNELLKAHFPEVLWQDPRKEAAAAGVDWNAAAMTLKRQGNYREPSIMVCGLMANLPTSYHFDIRVWDDIVIEKNAFSKEQIEATNEAWRKAAGLAADFTRDRMTGTHWAPNDTYRFVLDLGAAKLRHHDVYDDAGVPALHSTRFLEDFKLRLGSFHFAAQMRNKPLLGTQQTFALSWLEENRYEEEPLRLDGVNRYLLMDTATTKKKDSDYTVMAVVGVMRGVPLPHFFLLDLLRDRLSLVQTTDLLFELVEKWGPRCTFQERFGAQRDAEHFRYVMQERGLAFRIREMSEQVPKEERIRRLQPVFEGGRFHFPREIRRTVEGRLLDMVQVFRDEEYRDWTPAGGSKHDDMLDTLAWALSPVISRYVKAPHGAHVARAGKEATGPDYLQRAAADQQRNKGASGMRTGWSW